MKTAQREKNQNKVRHFSSQLFLAHSVATDPQSTFLHHERCRKHHLKNALVSYLEILFPYILYFKHAVEYASCKTLLAHTFIWKESALSNHIISACSFQSAFAAQRPWMQGCTFQKHRNTRHTWNSFHLQVAADVRQMQYPYAPVVKCKSMAAGMAAFRF